MMGDDEAALERLWHEKRGEVEPADLSGKLIVQLGVVTEPLNRHWFAFNNGRDALINPKKNGPAARTPLLHGHNDSGAAFLHRFLASGQRKRACDGVWFLVDDYQQDARCSIRMTSVLFPIA